MNIFRRFWAWQHRNKFFVIVLTALTAFVAASLPNVLWAQFLVDVLRGLVAILTGAPPA
jgi:hypothetical protein